MAKPTFESDLKRLEKIVEDLETGNLDLDKSLEKFEEGIRLTRSCSKRLEEAETKIEILIQDKEGKIKSVPFMPEEKGDVNTDE
jgi:exodeoxyribonuclease VII small subunit